MSQGSIGTPDRWNRPRLGQTFKLRHLALQVCHVWAVPFYCVEFPKAMWTSREWDLPNVHHRPLRRHGRLAGHKRAFEAKGKKRGYPAVISRFLLFPSCPDSVLKDLSSKFCQRLVPQPPQPPQDKNPINCLPMKATIKLYGLVSLKGDDAENWVLARFFSNWAYVDTN